MEETMQEIVKSDKGKKKTSTPEMKATFEAFMDDKTRLSWFLLAKEIDKVKKITVTMTSVTGSEAFTQLLDMGEQIKEELGPETLVSLHFRSGLYEGYLLPDSCWIVYKNESYIPGK